MAMDSSVTNFSAWLLHNGVAAYDRRYPSTDGNHVQNCSDIDAGPQFSPGSYPFGPHSLADDDGLGYTASASHPYQRSEIPRSCSVHDDEHNANREFCHNGNRFGGLSEVPEDAAVQDSWPHVYMRNNAPWSRLSSMEVTDHVPMGLVPVPSDDPFVQDRPFSFLYGIPHPAPESGSSQSVFSHQFFQDVDPLPQRTMTNEHHPLSNTWHDPSEPLRSKPMRRGSKVLPIHFQFGSREGPQTQPRHGNTWSRNMCGDGVSPRMPNTGPQPEEWRYNYWSRPASLMWVTIRRSYLTVKYLVLTIPLTCVDKKWRYVHGEVPDGRYN